MAVSTVFERLSKFDKNRWPADSPEIFTYKLPRFDGAKKMTSKEIERMVDRLLNYDKASCPPGSIKWRKNLGFNRYDFFRGNETYYGKKIKPDQLMCIIDRLLKPIQRTRVIQEKVYISPQRTQEQLNEILERLMKFDGTKLPTGSSKHRIDRGFNRYDFRATDAYIEKAEVKKVTSDELSEIIQRLSSFDPNKWPPESRSYDKTTK